MLPNNNCVFYDKYFIDDLYPNQYFSSFNQLGYSTAPKGTKNSSVDMSVALATIGKLIKDVGEKNCWIPAIINRETDQTKTKLLFRGTQSLSENLGLESAIKIRDPQFKNWKVKNGYLNSDWVLTSDILPFIPLYGILFWFKRNKNISGALQSYVPLSADEIPYNSVVSPTKNYEYDGVSITTSSRLAKKDSDTFYICDYDDYSYDPFEDINGTSDNPILPASWNRYFQISKLLEFNKDIKKEDIKFFIANTDPIMPNDPGLNLWIPNGETYSYFNSTEEQDESYKNKQASFSYLSPTLSSIYREIYHILTLRYKKRINKFSLNNQTIQQPIPFFTLQQSRLFKKLCYGLSTFPQIDRTTVSLLNSDEIFSIVDSYINSFNNVTNIKIDSLYFSRVLTNISRILTSKLNTDRSAANNQTINTGLVTSKTDLFHRLISKYSAKLRLYDKASIEYTPGLKYGPHVKINQDVMSRCDQTLEDQTIYNNVEFRVGEFVAKTEYSDSATDLVLSNTNVGGQKVRIPLWDIYKRELKDQRLPITAGPDIDVDFYDDTNLISSKQIQDPDDPEKEIEIREIAITLDNAITDIGGTFFDPNILGGEEIDVLWSRTSGPNCLRFSNDSISSQPGSSSLRYDTSTDNNPKVYIRRPGRYAIQLRVKASFGVLYDNIIIHVNDDLTYKRKDRLSPAQIQYLKPKNRLVILTPNIRECYFGKQGVFWTSYCDASVKIPQAKEMTENVNNMSQPGGSRPPVVVPLGNNYHKFAMPMNTDSRTQKKEINNNTATLKINYNCEKTFIDISKIVLSNLMDKNEECYNCESLYEGILDNKGFILDANNSFLFMDVTDNDRMIDVPTPGILSTDKTILKSYGGFSPAIVKTLGLNIPYHPAPGSVMQSIDTAGQILNEPVDENNKIIHVCHGTELPYDSTVNFKKGCFDPFSGWSSSASNLSSVLKFDPYHRPIQIFKGPGMYELKNDFSDGVAKIYKSSITLTVDPASYDPKEGEDVEAKDKEEISDHIVNYGYRTIGGNSAPKALSYNDEYDLNFPIESDDPVSNEEYCNDTLSEIDYNATYTMTRPGALIPYKDRTKNDPGGLFYDPESKRLRWNREGAGSIGNIEVKLNFLNYINPKDLVVWLEVDGCAKVSESLSAKTPKDQWYNGSYRSTAQKLSNIDNTDVKDYLYNLWDMNDNYRLDGKIPTDFETSAEKFQSTYRVYLLNRDHVSSTDFNISLKFSDLMNLDKNSSNNNVSSTLFIDNNISQSINGTIDLSPTLSAAGYNDEEILKYKKIVIENELLNNSHSFKKLIGMPIFGQNSESTQPGNSSSTTFTLCVAVVGESDSFIPYDKIASADDLTLSSIVTKNKSNLIDNSICSWELILHRTTENCGFLPGDSLGSISYEKDEPYIPGHSFIADMTDKLHLLPPSVLNAPNAYTLDGRLCRYSKESFNVPSFVPPPEINVNLFAFLLPIFGIVGTVAAISQMEAGLNQAARDLANALGAMRRQKQQETYNQKWYVPVYDKYPYGGHDKALLSVSKDGSLFYKLEASIFRYDNSIVMEKNKYKFCKLHYGGALKNLCIFPMQQIVWSDDLYKILFNKIAKRIYHKYPINRKAIQSLLEINRQKIDRLKDKTDASSITERENTISNINKLETNLKNIGEEIREGDVLYIIPENDQDQGVYIIYDGSDISGGDIEDLFLLRITNFKSLFKSNSYSQYNNIYDLSNSAMDLDDLVLDRKIIAIKGLRPYYFFKNNKSVTQIKPRTNFTEEETVKIEKLGAELLKNTKRLAYVLSLDAEGIKNEIDKQKIFEELGSKAEETDVNKIALRITEVEEEILNLKNTLSIHNIEHSGYLFDGNDYVSLFIIDNTDPNEMITTGKSLSISKEQSSRIVFYKNDMSVISNETKLPFDVWSLADTNALHFASPNSHGSCWGAGNYGYGSNVNRPHRLSNQNLLNTIQPFVDKINTRKNTFGNSAAFTMTPDNDTNDTIKGTTRDPGAFMYTIDTMNSTTINTNNNVTYVEKDTENTFKDSFIDLNNLVYESLSQSPHFAEIDVTVPDMGDIETGSISFDKDLKQKITYGFKNDHDESVSKLNERLEELNISIEDQNKLFNKANNKYFINGDGYPSSEKDNIIHTLDGLLNEKNQIEHYLSITSKATIPHVSVEIDESDGALSFTEKSNNNYYWINIDPEQGCSIDTDKTPKILVKVRYVCPPYNDLTTFNAKQICVPNDAYGGTQGGGDGQADGAEFIMTNFNDTTYTLMEDAIKKEKAKYPDLTWPETNFSNHFIERTFFLNFNGLERAQLVTAMYSYIIPIPPDKPDIDPDGNITNKVMNIFNLDNTFDLIVDFKRIPRALRSKDTGFDLYDPNENGDLVKSITPSPGGPLDGSLRVWKCLDAKTGYPIALTNYYKILNEMIFRNHFGSVDGVEHLGRIKSKTKDETYWVPYDYD